MNAPQNCSREFYEAEKKRLREAGHEWNEKEFDDLFATAKGNPKVISELHRRMADSPTHAKRAMKKHIDDHADPEKYAANMETFGALGDIES